MAMVASIPQVELFADNCSEQADDESPVCNGIAASMQKPAGVNLERAAEVIEEAIDNSCFPNELLEVWTASEAAVFLNGAMSKETTNEEKTQQSAAERAERIAVLMMMLQVLPQIGLPPDCFPKAAALFDIYRKNAAVHARKAAALPSVSNAICRILLKENSAVALPRAYILDGAQAWLLDYFRQSGAMSPTEDEVKVTELEVLCTLSWRLDQPNVVMWLDAFCARFDTATKEIFKDGVEWIQKTGTAHAIGLIQQATLFEYSPKQLAAGLFCLGFVSAKLLPLSSLCPADQIQMSTFAKLFERGCWGSLSECMIPDYVQNRLPELIESATDVSINDLQRFSLLVTCAVSAPINDACRS